MHARRICIFVLSFACSPKPGATEGGTSDSTGADATTASEPSTSSQTTTGAAPTEAAPTEAAPTGSSSSASTGELETTTGTGQEDLPTACQAWCEHFIVCLPEEAEPAEICLENCLSVYQGVSSCSEPAATMLVCLSAMTCEQVVAFWNADVLEPCFEQLSAAEMACGPGCVMSLLAGPATCSIGRQCGAVLQDYRCEGSTCVCFEEEIEIGSCSSVGFCMKSPAAQAQAASDCCGWDWP